MDEKYNMRFHTMYSWCIFAELGIMPWVGLLCG